jgi:hypothetical protein
MHDRRKSKVLATHRETGGLTPRTSIAALGLLAISLLLLLLKGAGSG